MFLKTGDRVIHRGNVETVCDYEEGEDPRERSRVRLSASGWVELSLDDYWDRHYSLCMTLHFNALRKKDLEKMLTDLEDYYARYKIKLLENLEKFSS